MSKGEAGQDGTAPSNGLAIRVLGPLEVRADGRPVVVDTRKALAILALLALERRPIARDELAAMFWPEADDESARGALRRTLSTLRAALGGRWVSVDRARVELVGDDVWVDAWAADAQARSTGHSAGRAGALASAVELHRGELLAGFTLRDSPDFDDWLATRAEERRRLLNDLLDRLDRSREAGGDLGGAVAAAMQRLELDSLDETAHRRVMELLARSGDRGGAIRQYRQCVAVLERELGVGPLAETTAMYEAIREGRLAPEAVLPLAAGSAPGSQPVEAGAGSPPPAGAIGPGPRSPTELPLVGRDAELAALVGTWRASTTDGRVAVLVGEAGIGKTRLAATLADRVAALGGTVLGARSYPGESAIPFGAIGGLLRAGLAHPDAPARLARLPADAVAQAARLVPEIRGLVPVQEGDEPLAEPAARLRLVDGLATAIVGLADGPQPGLVWLDDLAWADASTLEVITYLANRLARRAILLLAAWRREDTTTPLELLADAAERDGRATVISLERLDRDAVAALVRAVPGRAVDPDDLASESEGLPLYVAELLASSDPASGGMPRGVRSVLASRLAGIDGTAAQVLAAAAVVGRTFDFELVRQTSGRTPEEAIDGFEALLSRGILREATAPGQPAAGYDFAHGRLRDLAYEGISLARRRLLHARAAEALRTGHAQGVAEAARLAAIGDHEREAGRFTAAAEAFAAAGGVAAAIHAPVEALAHYEAALALGHPDHVGIRQAIGDARIRVGDYAGAIEVLEAAAGDETEPVSLAAIEQRLGTVHARRGDLSAADSHLAAADELLAAIPPAAALFGAAGVLRARVLADRALVAHRLGDEERASALATRALAGLDAGGSGRAGESAVTGARARSLQVLGLVGLAIGDLAGARANLEAALEMAGLAGPTGPADLAAVVAIRHALAQVVARSGDLGAATALAETALLDGRRLGDRHVEAALENTLADLLHDAGREDESMAHLKAAVGLFAEVSGRRGELEPEIWKLVEW